jgi:uncharacterized protein YhbP (UPF0306 family)
VVAIKQGIPLEVATYLGMHHIITLSTTSFTGMPHANTVAFASDERRLYFYSGEDTTLARNIRDNRRVSFTVDDYTSDWRKVRELQGVGSCEIGTSEHHADVLRIVREKFGNDFAPPPGNLYVVSPFEMHFVDFEYSKVAAAPEVYRQIYQLNVDPQPMAGAVSTTLNQLVFKTGDVIFRPGAGSGEYYVVTSGEVEIRAEGHGADQTVVRVGPGGMFGDQAALRGQRGNLTAHATLPTMLLAVDRDSVRDLSL